MVDLSKLRLHCADFASWCEARISANTTQCNNRRCRDRADEAVNNKDVESMVSPFEVVRPTLARLLPICSVSVSSVSVTKSPDGSGVRTQEKKASRSKKHEDSLLISRQV